MCRRTAVIVLCCASAGTCTSTNTTASCPHGLGDVAEGVMDFMGDLRECCYDYKDAYVWRRMMSCIPWLLDEVPIVLNAAADFIGAFGRSDLIDIIWCLVEDSRLPRVLDMIFTALHTCGLRKKALGDIPQAPDQCKCKDPTPECCCYSAPPSASSIFSGSKSCFNFANLPADYNLEEVPQQVEEEEALIPWDARVASVQGQRNTPRCPKISWEGKDGNTPCPRPIAENGKFVAASNQLSSTKCAAGKAVSEVDAEQLQAQQCPGFPEGSEKDSNRCCCYYEAGYMWGTTTCFDVGPDHLLEGRRCPNLRRLDGAEEKEVGDKYCPSKYGTYSPEAGCNDKADLKKFGAKCAEIEAGLMKAEETAGKEGDQRKKLEAEAEKEQLTADLFESGCRKQDEERRGNVSLLHLDARTASLQRQAAKTWNRRNVSTAATETAAMDVGTSDAADIAAMDVGGTSDDECKILEPVLDKFTLLVDKYTACTMAPRRWSFIMSSQLICVFLEKEALSDAIKALIDIIEKVVQGISAVRQGDITITALNDVVEVGPGHILDVVLNCVWRGKWKPAMAKFFEFAHTFGEGWDTSLLMGKIAKNFPKPRLSKDESCTCPKAPKTCCCYKELFFNDDNLVHCYNFDVLANLQAEECPRVVIKGTNGWLGIGKSEWACRLDRDKPGGIAASDMLADIHCPGKANAKGKTIQPVKITNDHLNKCSISAKELKKEYKDIAENVICAQTDPTAAWGTGGKCGTPPEEKMNCCYTDYLGKKDCMQFTVKEHIPFRTHLCPPARWVKGIWCPIWDIVDGMKTIEVYPTWWKPDKTGSSFDAWKGTTDHCRATWESAADVLTAEKVPSRTICCRFCLGRKCSSFKFFTKFHPECPTLNKGTSCRVDNTFTGIVGTSTACDPESAPLWTKQGPEAGRATYCGHDKKRSSTCCCYGWEVSTAGRLNNCFKYEGECPAVVWRHIGNRQKLPCPQDLWPWQHPEKEGEDIEGAPANEREEAPPKESYCQGSEEQFDEEWCGNKMDETSPELAAPRSVRTCCCYEQKGYAYNSKVCYAYHTSSLKEANVCPNVDFKSGWTTSYPCPSSSGSVEPAKDTKDTCDKQKGKVPSFSKVAQTWCEKQVNPEKVEEKEKAAQCKEMEAALKELNAKTSIKDGTYYKSRQRSLARIRQILGAKRSGRATGSGTRRSIKKAARKRMMKAVRRMFRGVVRTYNQLNVANKS